MKEFISGLCFGAGFLIPAAAAGLCVAAAKASGTRQRQRIIREGLYELAPGGDQEG